MSPTCKIFLRCSILMGVLLRATAQVLPATVTIRVFDRSQTPSSTLLDGEKTAFEILHRAGIESVWLNCQRGTPECIEPPTTSNLVVTILKRGSAMANVDMLGLAVQQDDGNGAYCYIFENKLNEISGAEHISASRLLGAAAAHEIGHLLKGSHSHSPTGLMSARWSPHELGEVARGVLWFTKEDAELMQARLAQLGRVNQQTANLQAKR